MTGVKRQSIPVVDEMGKKKYNESFVEIQQG